MSIAGCNTSFCCFPQQFLYSALSLSNYHSILKAAPKAKQKLSQKFKSRVMQLSILYPRGGGGVGGGVTTG